jgi:hypothetical protein
MSCVRYSGRPAGGSEPTQSFPQRADRTDTLLHTLCGICTLAHILSALAGAARAFESLERTR